MSALFEFHRAASEQDSGPKDGATVVLRFWGGVDARQLAALCFAEGASHTCLWC